MQLEYARFRAAFHLQYDAPVAQTIYLFFFYFVGFMKNKLYRNDAGIKFAKLSVYLAKRFPREKLQLLKLAIISKSCLKIFKLNVHVNKIKNVCNFKTNSYGFSYF